MLCLYTCGRACIMYMHAYGMYISLCALLCVRACICAYVRAMCVCVHIMYVKVIIIYFYQK